jgi:O-acetyl-ADP-ribose deacetylase (regulator of RNase III)
MLKFTTGNLLDAPAEALVNTVNTEGVMGKGIALMFREAFDENYRAYKAACDAGKVKVGEMFVTETGQLANPRFIINFPTKKHWRHPSRLEYIETGLADLARVIEERHIRSVAVPPLGCGNGGLDWSKVRPAIEATLGKLQGVEIAVFEPVARYQNKPKTKGVDKLTTARALVLEAVRGYSQLGFECTNLEVQKLGYFLQRVVLGLKLSNPLKLQFEPNKFGPYADNLRLLLDGLDGTYLHCSRRLADAGPMEPIRLDLERAVELDAFWSIEAHTRYREAAAMTERLTQGFETPFLMELLSTVDWIASSGATADAEEVTRQLGFWPGGKWAAKRKQELFTLNDVRLALARLTEFKAVLFPEASSAAGGQAETVAFPPDA